MIKPKANATGVTDVNLTLRPNIDVNRFRIKRFQRFLKLLDDNVGAAGTTRILDIGGVIAYWEGLRPLWKHLSLEITIINIDAKHTDASPYFIRDGNALDLSHYKNNSFDIVHSNSVIEHVGHWSEMMVMASEIRRLAPHYFIQTPNFWFPMEPHYRTLFFQWYPEIIRARMSMRKKRGFMEPDASLDAAMQSVQSVNLLSGSQMHELFPDGTIEYERVFGLKKSIMAIR